MIQLKKSSLIFILLLFCFIPKNLYSSSIGLAKKLSGRILLQVESLGEAWYLNPANHKRYYMGKPADAYQIMRALSFGISDVDLAKISIGYLSPQNQLEDTDKDGLKDSLEIALGLDANNPDSDNDGYDDKTEINNNYNPLGVGKLPVDSDFTQKHLGKIFIQTQKYGQAWYLNSYDKKRYFLGRPYDAFNLMRNLGLGIKNQDIGEIPLYSNSAASKQNIPSQKYLKNEIIYQAAAAIRNDNLEEAMNYFISEMRKGIEFTMKNSSREIKYAIANLLQSAKKISSDEAEKIYATAAHFDLGGQTKKINFHVKKQEDGNWLIANL